MPIFRIQTKICTPPNEIIERGREHFLKIIYRLKEKSMTVEKICRKHVRVYFGNSNSNQNRKSQQNKKNDSPAKHFKIKTSQR